VKFIQYELIRVDIDPKASNHIFLVEEMFALPVTWRGACSLRMSNPATAIPHVS